MGQRAKTDLYPQRWRRQRDRRPPGRRGQVLRRRNGRHRTRGEKDQRGPEEPHCLPVPATARSCASPAGGCTTAAAGTARTRRTRSNHCRMVRRNQALLIGALALAALVSGRVAEAQPPASMSLPDALARAVEANPTLAAARAARAIGAAGIDAARQRPNPEVSVEVERETPHWAFAGTVPLEVSGKRQRRVDVATATLAVTEADTARIAAQVRSAVRRAYFTAVAAVRRVAIAQELEALATRARDAAQDRFQTGA